jgi:proline racemase
MNVARADNGAAAPLFLPERVSVIDSHTEGEPTRVVIAGWPALRSHDMPGRRTELTASWDHLRSAIVCEPRGHDAMVGALLTEAVTPAAAAGVVFFNNVGCLGMCGHGLIGVVRTLLHLGRVEIGEVRIDTPVGTVTASCEQDGAITIANVPAVCHALDVTVTVPSAGRLTGDVAWGGNWFFITHVAQPALELANAAELTQVSRDIAAALRTQGITGADGADIDHVELTSADTAGAADSVNFVLCPGGAWDRSPCGTGTSAKLAVMHARGQIEAGQRWRQRSITGGTFTAWIEERDGALHPNISGRAWITGESELLFDPGDPLRCGFTAS